MLEFLCLFSLIKNFIFFFWILFIFYWFYLLKVWERVFNFDWFFYNYLDVISVKSMLVIKLF